MTDYAFSQVLLRGLGAQPQRFHVHPRDLHDEDHEPILGVGHGACCTSCAQGKTCEGSCPSKSAQAGGSAQVGGSGSAQGVGKGCCASCKQGGPCDGCSKPKAPISVPGSTSFPVGFGQTGAPITTTSVPVAVVSSWAFPLTVAFLSAAAGFGLAYAIRSKQG